ncbi:MAG: putative metal-binding motif-containing protein [Myxococcales bacterium]|nr:putative metal-binding motif-containing protein [Myxococcales bacterium]
MRTKQLGWVFLGLGVAALGCAANNGAANDGESSGGSAGAAPETGGAPSTGGGLNLGGASSGGATAYCSNPGPDADGDGFTTDDCNDCDPNVNPGALDVAGNGIDEDCNGVADDTVTSCDSVIVGLDSADALDAARAIGLCHFATASDKHWGVVSAKYVMADGSPGMNDVSHGLLPDFGPSVSAQEGKRMLVLSSGTARRPSDVDYEDVSGTDTGTMGTAPPGFPKDSTTCSVQTASDTTTYNPAALELELRVPTNAKSLSFKFDFYTYEFPVFVCSEFNDFFVALLDPPSKNAKSGNISFDSQGNPVSVNNGFLEVCAAQEAGGKPFACKLGQSELTGTGFEDGAATGWLETNAPVSPGEIVKLRFAIWDMGDGILDSTVLIDDLRFSAEPASGAVTKPVATPK